MQEELTKHTKKIYDNLKNPRYSISEKVVEVLIEVAIIVFAVTLSISLHSWNEHRHQQQEVRLFLDNLKEDLKKDIEALTIEKGEYVRTNKAYESILSLNQSQFDSLSKIDASVDFPIHTHGQIINTGNYEGFKSSGKIGYIENEKLKQKILEYYQKTVPNMIQLNKLYVDFLLRSFDRKIEYGGKKDKEIYSDRKLRMTISYILLLGKNNIRVYDETGLRDAKDIVAEIHKYMN